ncbi:MAG: FAD binding domain-containing protein [Anaerolineae bacterium]
MMQAFDYYRPQSFEEAFELLTLPDKTVFPMAGATDLIPMTRDENWRPDVVVDVKALPGLRRLEEVEAGPCDALGVGKCLYVGAAVRMNELVRSDLVRRSWGLLAQGAATVGNEQVRNRATLGGNLCTASPAADTAPALLALEALALIRGPEGERSVPLADFFRGPRKTVLKKGELLVGLLVPPHPPQAAATYIKLSRRKAADLSIVGVACLAYPRNGGYRWRLALGAVAPTPVRASKAETILDAGHGAGDVEKAAACALEACAPIADIRSGLQYRRAMIVRVTRRAIEEVLTLLGKEV